MSAAVAAAPRMLENYRETVIPGLVAEFGYLNVMQVPKLEKVVVNIGIGEASQNAKALDAATNDLRIITGQQPSIRKARKSVAAFKLREGMPVGLKVTVRGVRMYEFVDRLLSVALPRIRDFRGVVARFDGHGNLTLGLPEQLIFPEIDYDKIDKLRGMEITIVTTAKTDAEGRSLLAALGMPFRR
ncbi:MAG TPA: 50S ribosomal protein L5 [Candidatus Dormibacteraeota bacterium]|nr:50S ribosomal protein L5 [Candidatus Dormibacteraeota bacterium]